MKSLCVIVLFALVAIVSLGDASPAPKCIQNQGRCQNNGQCCTGCCCTGRCAPANQCPKPPVNPCKDHKCPHGQVCKLEQVLCIRQPCNPIPVCVNRKHH